MYVVPIVLLVLIAIAIFAGPILAVILFAVFLAGLGVYKFLGPGTEPERAADPEIAAEPKRTGAGRSEGDEDEGPWGETWPEQSR